MRGRRPIQGIHFIDGGSVERSSGQKGNVEIKGNLIKTYKRIPVEAYHEAGSLNPYSRMAGRDKHYGVFQLNRGCRWNCAFCGVRHAMGGGVRTSPVAPLLEEIRYLVETRGVRHFEVLDDDFLVNREAVARLLEGLVALRKHYGITWSANNGLIAASITEDLLSLFCDSGCIGFKVGIESGNREILRRMRKPGDVKLFERTAAMIRKYPRLFVGGNYILGLFEEETLSQMRETFRLSCGLGFDWSSFTLFQ